MWKPRRETLPITRELGRTWPSVAATPARNHRRRRHRYRPALARSCTTTVIPHQPGAAPESLRTPQNATTTTTTRCHVAAPTGRTGPRTVPNLAELGPPREKERERKRETMWKSRGGVLRASYPHPFPFRFFLPSSLSVFLEILRTIFITIEILSIRSRTGMRNSTFSVDIFLETQFSSLLRENDHRGGDDKSKSEASFILFIPLGDSG